jgi:hypothetical protein
MNLFYLEDRISRMKEGDSVSLSTELACTIFPAICGSRYTRSQSTFEQFDLWATNRGLTLEASGNCMFKITKPRNNKKPSENWIKINSEADLPTNNPVAVYWTLRKGHSVPMFVVEPFFNDRVKTYWMGNYSHYLLINSPSLPTDL